MGGRWTALLTLLFIASTMTQDTNTVYSPCTDSTIKKLDGFTLGLAFSSKDKFFFNQTQLSPCDTRLQLSAAGAQLAVFRPKVDEISLLTLDNSSNPSASGGYMVAFAGRKYAAVSPPTFAGDDTRVVTNFTLVLVFEKGILYNLFWMKFGCEDCGSGECVDGQDCATQISTCKGAGGCNIGIQVVFSGTDMHRQVLNSWYESKKLRTFSLFGLYAGLRDRMTNIF